MLGLVQVTLQWILFSIVYVPFHPSSSLLTSPSLILYLAYFPTHLKYCRTLPLPATDLNDDVLSARTQQPEQEPTERDPLVDRAHGSNLVKYETTSEWRIAVIMSLTVLIHLYVLLPLPQTPR